MTSMSQEQELIHFVSINIKLLTLINETGRVEWGKMIKKLIKMLQTLGKESKIKGIVDMDGEEDGEDSESRDEPPRDYLCPVTCVLMKDPVCAADGFTYERKAIEKLNCFRW